MAFAALDRKRTIAPAGYNRWLVPPAALAIHLCIGQVYATSVYKTTLVAHFDTSLTSIGIDLLDRDRDARPLGRRLRHLGRRAAARARRCSPPRCCWSIGFLVGALGIATASSGCVYLGLRRHRRHRPGHRLHLPGLDADQVVPGPARAWPPAWRSWASAAARWSPRPLRGSCSRSTTPGTTPDQRRSPAARQRLRLFVTLGVVYLVVMMFGALLVRVPGRRLEAGRLRPVDGRGQADGHHGERHARPTPSRRRSSGCCGSCCSATSPPASASSSRPRR